MSEARASEVFVEMTHPDVHLDSNVEPATATLEAFNEVWAPKGWVKAEQVEPQPNPASADPPEYLGQEG